MVCDTLPLEGDFEEEDRFFGSGTPGIKLLGEVTVAAFVEGVGERNELGEMGERSGGGEVRGEIRISVPLVLQEGEEGLPEPLLCLLREGWKRLERPIRCRFDVETLPPPPPPVTPEVDDTVAFRSDVVLAP